MWHLESFKLSRGKTRLPCFKHKPSTAKDASLCLIISQSARLTSSSLSHVKPLPPLSCLVHLPRRSTPPASLSSQESPQSSRRSAGEKLSSICSDKGAPVDNMRRTGEILNGRVAKLRRLHKKALRIRLYLHRLQLRKQSPVPGVYHQSST